MVYFIQAINDRNGPVKIGFTDRDGKRALLDRLGSLQTGNPSELQVVATMEGGMEREQRLHAALDYYRIRGEWFRCEGEARKLVDRHRLVTPLRVPPSKQQRWHKGKARQVALYNPLDDD